MDVQRETRWMETVAMIRGLWPDWSGTAEQLAEWREALAGANVGWVRDAVREHYRTCRYREPRLSEVLRCFRLIRDSGSSAQTQETSQRMQQIATDDREANAFQEQAMKALMGLDPEILRDAAAEVRRRYMTHVPSDQPDDGTAERIIKRAMTDRMGGRNQSDDPTAWTPLMVGFVWTFIFNPPHTVKR